MIKLLFIILEKPEDVNKFCNICTKYKDKMYVDVKYGRYTLDGCSVLAISSLIGKPIRVYPSSNDNLLLTYFTKEIEDMGGFIKNKDEFEDS